MTERIDQIGFGGLRLIQEPTEFCYGVDAVILADFAARQGGFCEENFEGRPIVPKRRGSQDCRAVDLGTGTGIIPLILSYKTTCSRLVGVEIQAGSCARAARSAELNGLQERVHFFCADVKNFCDEAGMELLGSVELVTCNPPYTQGQGGLTNRNSAKAIARHETTAGLADFVQCASRLLKPKGSFFMVHRPSRLVDLCAAGRVFGLEPKELCFVSPKEGEIPNIMLVHMIKGGGPELRLLRPLYIYDEAGNYTEELRACYR